MPTQHTPTVIPLNYIPVRPLDELEKGLVDHVRGIYRKEGRKIAYKSDQEIMAYLEGIGDKNLLDGGVK